MKKPVERELHLQDQTVDAPPVRRIISCNDDQRNGYSQYINCSSSFFLKYKVCFNIDSTNRGGEQYQNS